MEREKKVFFLKKSDREKRESRVRSEMIPSGEEEEGGGGELFQVVETSRMRRGTERAWEWRGGCSF